MSSFIREPTTRKSKNYSAFVLIWLHCGFLLSVPVGFSHQNFVKGSSQKFNSVWFSLRVFVSPRFTTEKRRIFVAFKVLVHSQSTTCTAISSWISRTSQPPRLNGCQAPLLKILQIPPHHCLSTSSLSAVIIVDNWVQEISWKTYKLREADSRPKLARKLCVRVLNSRISCDTIHVFIHQKTDKQSKNCLLLSKISQSNCKWLFLL